MRPLTTARDCSNGAETSYNVLMERFVAAVEEDYADTEFLVRLPGTAGTHMALELTLTLAAVWTILAGSRASKGRLRPQNFDASSIHLWFDSCKHIFHHMKKGKADAELLYAMAPICLFSQLPA